MLCEMCGNERGRLTSVEVEGVTMSVCSECAKFGQVKEPETPRREVRPPQARPGSGSGFTIPGLARNRPSPAKKPSKDALSLDEEELVDDYSTRIRKAREARGLSHEDLGRKINEKRSVIAKLEAGTFRPDETLIRKLERFLNIKLKEKVEAVELRSKDLGGPMTLGDFIKHEKK